MRKLILAQLKKANPGVPDHLLGLIADKLLPKVTTAEEVEGAISEFEESSILSIPEMAKLLQQEGDRRVSAIKKPAKTEVAIEEEEEEPASDMGKVLKMLEGLSAKVTKIEQKETTQTIQSKMEAQLKEKGIPSVFLKGRVPSKEEDIEAILEEIESDFTESGLVLKPTGSKLTGFKAPVVAGGGAVIEDDKVDDSISTYLESKKAANSVQVK